jgi:integrase
VTVFKRGDKWVAKVWDREGKRWTWLGTYLTRKEARAVEHAASPASGSLGITVEDFCERWLSDYARSAPSTRTSYSNALRGFRREHGRRRLASITRPEAQRWAQQAPYFQYRVVRTMYADALRDDLIPANPFSGLRIPVPQGRRRIQVLSEDQIRALGDRALEVYAPDKHGPTLGPTVRALVLVAGFTGLRPGELAGLDWGDVDLRRSQLHVRRALDAKGNLRAPKNGEPRICVMPPAARDALASLDRHTGEAAVFLTPRGRRFGKGAIHRYFAPVRAAFGQHIDFYELRHACATLLLERGLSPEDVAIQLGHRDGGRLVATLYGHPSEDRARERIAMAFSEAPEKPVASWSHAESGSAG